MVKVGVAVDDGNQSSNVPVELADDGESKHVAREVAAALVNPVSWLKTILPLAEFLLLLVALMIYIEIAPVDMAHKCDGGLQGRCLDVYVGEGGEYESALTDPACGVARVQCWRSGLKDILYNGRDVAEGTTTVALTEARLGLSARVLAQYKPGLAFCLCMLTNNGTAALPRAATAWRSETDYFCPVLESINQGIGISGLALACLIVSVRSMLEAVESGATDPANLAGLGLTAVLWLAWSIAVVSLTASYSTPGDSATTDCEMPDANIFYYVFVIGCLSTLGAVYALWVLARVIYLNTDSQWTGDSMAALNKRETPRSLDSLDGGAKAKKIPVEPYGKKVKQVESSHEVDETVVKVW